VSDTLYLQHLPALIVHETDCVNLLCDQKTYQLDRTDGEMLAHLLSLRSLDTGLLARYQHLIEFLAEEGLARLTPQHCANSLSIRDFRHAEGAAPWLALRNACLAFIGLTALAALLTLERSAPGFKATQAAHPWAGFWLFGPMLLHESVHQLAAWAMGVKGRPGIGLRGWLFLVATVTFPTLYSLPRHQRWLPILLPMCVDCAMYWLLLPHTGHAIAALFCLSYAAGIFWQFMVCLRTDLYLFVATSFNQPDLNRLARARVRAPRAAEPLLASERHALAGYFGLLAVSVAMVARLLQVLLA
jgi:hypothetical protein